MGLPPGVFELGIDLFDVADRGQGIGRLALTQLLKRLFEQEGAHRVQLTTDVDNAAMRTLSERLGFGFEGRVAELHAVDRRTARLRDVRDDRGRLRGCEDQMDLNKLTIKSQAALEGAHQQAVARNHQTIEPEHLLFALLSDPEGVVYPLLHQIGVTPKTVRDQVDQALDRIPKVYAQGQAADVRISPPTGKGARPGGRGSRGAHRRVHLDRAPAPGAARRRLGRCRGS